MVVTMKNAIFWMLRHVALVRTDVSEELSTSIIRVTRIGQLGTMLAVTSKQCMLRSVVVPSSPILVTLMMKVSSYKSHTANISEDGFLQMSY
jgi:hypothetical protein